MTNLPERADILNQNIITSDWKTYYGNIRDFISQMLGGSEPEVSVVQEESISPTKAVIALDLDELVQESLLKNISIVNYPTSQWLFLVLNNPDKKITIAHGQPGDGAIYTFTQENEQIVSGDVIILKRDGNVWQQVDLMAYARATDDELAEGTSKFKSPTVAQLKPYLSNATSSAMGVIVYALRKPEGTLKCDTTEYQLNTFPQLAEYLQSGKIPSTSFSKYNSLTSSQGFCEKFGLDTASGKFKCPNLQTQKIGKTTYFAYVAVYNTVTAESLIELQGILDQCLTVQSAINAKGQEITNYVNNSLTELANKKNEYIQNLKTQEQSSLTSLTSATNTHLGELDDKKDISIAEIEAKKTEITTEGQTQVDRVIQTGNNQVQSVQNAGAKTIADARTWATGEDSAVNELEQGEHSSRGYADLSAAYAETDEDVPISSSPLIALDVIKGDKGDPGQAATISVGTVTTGNAGTQASVVNVGTTTAARFNFTIPKGDKGDQGEKGPPGDLGTNRISNCILSTPRDIKLELSDHAVVLKSGSKYYNANGTSETITKDYTVKNTSQTTQNMYICVQPSSQNLWCGYMTGGTVSTRPEEPITYALYYNTTTKICEYYNGSVWTTVSLPIAIATRDTEGFTAINKVFNGFGYIGSSIFALPGTIISIPNGFNDDNTRKNTEWEIDRLYIRTITEARNCPIAMSTTGIGLNDTYFYDSDKNLIGYYVLEDKRYYTDRIIIGDIISDSTGKITDIYLKKTLSFIDSNDSDLMDTILPAGIIMAYMGGTPPKGWLECNGQQVSRTRYKRLFDLLGTSFGPGNGTTTFTLPNLRERYIKGSNIIGAYIDAGLPDITHTHSIGYRYPSPGVSGGSYNGIGSGSGWFGFVNETGTSGNNSGVSSIYGKSDTVTPLTITAMYIIKY
jgi:hypothetical protein